jgi:hypothetical protein
MPEDRQELRRNGNRDDLVEVSALGASGSHIFHDADKLLRLAEDLQEKCERNERRFMIVIVMVLCTTMTAVGITLAASNYRDQSRSTSPWHMGAALVAASYALIFTLYAIDSLSKLRRTIRRDRRAYFEIVDMLRELERYFGRKGSNSRLERAEFLIRLSRLDIGPGISFTRLLLGMPVHTLEIRSKYLKRPMEKSEEV